MKPEPTIRMQSAVQPEVQPRQLLPLVRSIGRELTERLDAIRRLEQHFRGVALTPENAWVHRAELTEAAIHYEAMDQARSELSALACSIIGIDPVTVSAYPRTDSVPPSIIW